MAEIKTAVHPVLYFKCDEFTSTLDECADMFELQTLARMFSCRRNGKTHYLVIAPYHKEDKTGNRFEIWKEKLKSALVLHGISVHDAAPADLRIIHSLIREHPEYFGVLCFKLTEEEREALRPIESFGADL